MPQPFVVDGTTAGDVTELEGSLSFVKVSESGHMVPMDQPRNAVEMLRRFINGEAIAGGEWKPPAAAAIDRKVDAVRVVGSRAGPRRAMPTAA
jgi:serine carboxypeptidase-like clade 4